jgi:hypothetical protein
MTNWLLLETNRILGGDPDSLDPEAPDPFNMVMAWCARCAAPILEDEVDYREHYHPANDDILPDEMREETPRTEHLCARCAWLQSKRIEWPEELPVTPATRRERLEATGHLVRSICSDAVKMLDKRGMT